MREIERVARAILDRTYKGTEAAALTDYDVLHAENEWRQDKGTYKDYARAAVSELIKIAEEGATLPMGRKLTPRDVEQCDEWVIVETRLRALLEQEPS